MKNTEINIPEELQQICRDFAEVAIKHNLYRFTGNFKPRTNWGGEISFSWGAGRHEEDSNELSITTQMFVHTKVKIPNMPI